MDQRLNLGNEVRELKLGSTFNTPKPRTSFHTLKYDFKPASVDLSKTATLDVSSNNQVTVTMPHLNSSGVPKTVFKGNQRNYTKECVLIIDKVTGEITLEKLHHNIQVKKTRSETTNNKSSMIFGSSHQQQPQQQSALPSQQQQQQQPTSSNNSSGSGSGSASTSASGSTASSRPFLENNTKRVSNKTRVSTGIRKNAIGTFVQRHSPIQGSPSYPLHRSPQQAPAWNANNGQSTLPSIPIIGMDDDMPSISSSTTTAQPTAPPPPKSYNNAPGLPSLTPEQSPFNSYHSNKSSLSASASSSKLSPKLSAPPLPTSNNSMSQSNLVTHPNSSHNSSSFQNNSSYDKLLSRQSSGHHHHHHHNNHHHQLPKDDPNEVGVLSTSDSSDSSDSDSNSNSNSNSNSSSDSDSNSNSDDDDDNNMHVHHTNAMLKPNPINNGTGSLPALLLDEDLRLSSNSSDSDDD